MVLRRSIDAHAHAHAKQLAQERLKVSELLEVHLRTSEELAGAHERARIARDLHDGLGHCLATAQLYVELAERRVGGTPEEVEDALGRISAALDRALDELRGCVAVMRDTPTPHSLSAALKRLADAVPAGTVRVSVEVEGSAHRLGARREVALFRVAQEAITNAVKHSGARAVCVRLSYRRDAVVLEVEDDGEGCASPVLHHGLRGAQERLEEWGGRLEIETEPGRGYRVQATMGRHAEHADPSPAGG